MPQAANGELLRLLQELMKQSNSFLLADIAPVLSQDHVRVVMEDFGRARSQLQWVLGLKLAALETLPLSLLGMSHHCIETARACAKRCLLQFASAGDEARHHGLSLLLLAHPDNPLQEQVVKFSNGASLNECPELQVYVAKLRFVLTSERVIEGVHSLTHRDTRHAPHHSAVHVAFGPVWKRVRDLIAQQPHVMPSLASACSRCRSPSRVVEELRLARHPLIAKLIEKWGSRHKINRWAAREVVEVLFHVDGHTLFQSHSELERRLLQTPKDSESRLRALSADSTYEQLWKQAAFGFLRHQLSQIDFSSYIWSLGQLSAAGSLRDVGDHMHSLSSAVNPVILAAGENEDLMFAEEEAHPLEPLLGSRAQMAETQLQLQPLRMNLAMFRIVNTECRAARRFVGASEALPLPRGCMAISEVDVVHADQQTLSLQVAVEAHDATNKPIMLLDVQNLKMDSLATLRQWSPSDGLQYHLHMALPHDQRRSCESCAGVLLEAGALPGGPPFMNTPQNSISQDALEVLVARNVVECVNAQTSQDQWRLTESGLSVLQCVRTLKASLASECHRKFFQIRQEVPVQDRHAFELLLMLENDGFTFHVKVRGRRGGTAATVL